MLDTAATATRPRTVRSRTTNDLLHLRGHDGRSLVARRFRDLVHGLVAELGGEARLDEAARIQVRQAAALSVRVEQMQSDIVAGKAVDSEQLVRVSNSLTRTLASLRDRRKPTHRRPTARDVMAAKVAAEVAGA